MVNFQFRVKVAAGVLKLVNDIGELATVNLKFKVSKPDNLPSFARLFPTILSFLPRQPSVCFR